VQNEIETVRHYFQRHGFKLTPQRQAIVERVFSTHSHFSADDLHDMMRDSGTPVSKATIYRTLSLLAEGRFVEGLRIGEEMKYYEHVLGHEHHDHLICVECHKIVEFRSEAIEELQEEIVREHGFKSLYHSHKIFGYCADCRDRASNGQRS